jgi:hypothetical protein
MAKRVGLLIEMLLLFAGVPLAIYRYARGQPFFPILWVFMINCLIYLLWIKRYPRRRFGVGQATRRDVLRVGGRFLAVALVLTLWVVWRLPDYLFYLPRERPALWLLITVAYPVLSVYPQGIIYRAFFEQRYASLFNNWPALMVPVASLAFAFSHIIFISGWSVVLTFLGGWMFFQTYRRTQSLLLSAWEHALYGWWMFTVGLGSLFYHGAVQ